MIDTLEKLAVSIETMDNSGTAELGFDMNWDYESSSKTNHPCGSAACIIGHLRWKRPDLRDARLSESIFTLEPELDREEIFRLCFPHHYEPAMEATPAQAARAIRILDQTGKCDWERAIAEAAK